MTFIFPITDDLHTSDAYYSNVVCTPDLLILPYVNVGIVQHPLNRDAILSFIDFSYVICTGIKRILTQAGVIGGITPQLTVLYFGGAALDGADISDIAVICDQALLHTLPESRIAKHGWHLAGSTQNVSAERAKAFFEGQMMPTYVRELVDRTLPAKG